MTVDPIVARILADAKAEAEQLLADARAKAEEKRLAQQAELENNNRQALKRAGEEARLQHERMLRMAMLEERKRDLAMKREVIQTAFDQALEHLQNLPAEQARAFMHRILMDAHGDEQIVIDPSSEPVFTPAFLQQLNAALREAGKPGALTLSDERRNIGAGCILLSGGVESNCTFAAILKEKRAALESTIAEVLFPQAV